MSEGGGLPQLDERIWDLVMTELPDKDGGACHIWAVIDLEEALIRSLLVEFRLPAMSRVQELVIGAIAEPLPPGRPARPVELRIPGAPHARRRQALEPAVRTSLQWTLKGLGVDCDENTAEEDMDATLAVLAVLAYKRSAGLFTGAPFHEAELCRVAYRILDLRPWETGLADWLLTLEVLRPERSGLTHTIVMFNPGAGPETGARGVSVLHSWMDAAELCARWRTEGWVEAAHVQGMLSFLMSSHTEEHMEAVRRRSEPGIFPEGATGIPVFRMLRPGFPHLPLDADTGKALWLALEATAAFLADRVGLGADEAPAPGVYTIGEGVEVRVEALRKVTDDAPLEESAEEASEGPDAD